MTATVRHSEANQKQLSRAEALLRQLADAMLKTGVYGSFSINCVVNDGVIQEVKERKEQAHRPA